MEIRLKLRRVANSYVITIPAQVVCDLKLKAGDNILLDVKDLKINTKKGITGFPTRKVGIEIILSLSYES